MVVNVTTWELGDLEFNSKHYRPHGLIVKTPYRKKSRCRCKPLFLKLNVLTVASLYIFKCLINKIIIPANSLVGLRNLNNRIKEGPISQCSFLSNYSY